MSQTGGTLMNVNKCGTPMRHRDGRVSPCVLDKDHFVTVEDSDHVDEHGHTAKVLVLQSTLRQIEAVSAYAKAGGAPESEREPDDNWRELYAWLGQQARVSARESEENELATNLDVSVGPRYHAEAFRQAREQMLLMDPTLPHRARPAYDDRNRNHSRCTACHGRIARVAGPDGPRWAHASSGGRK